MEDDDDDHVPEVPNISHRKFIFLGNPSVNAPNPQLHNRKPRAAGVKLEPREDLRSNIIHSSWRNPPERTRIASGRYAVYLSFCGNDVPKSFVDCLYNSLVEAHIHTFIDDGKFQIRPKYGELLAPIAQSEIVVPILSKNYASRTWRLQDLTTIVEFYKLNAKTVLPIFYNLKPSVVHEQSGNYMKAFSQHKRIFGDETIEQWRRALRIVACLRGWELEYEFNGHQEKLVEVIVSTIQQELQKAKGFSGIEFCMNEVMGLLDMKVNDVRIIGIHGKRASGKTTLARLIYNQIFSQFDRCSFIAGVSEKSKNNGLESLQKHLINDLFRGTVAGKIHNVDEGIHIISRKFRRKKVLVILDDISREEQLHVLAREHTWFGLRSRIILTTRNRDLLDVLKVHGSCEVTSPLQKPIQLLGKPLMGSEIHYAIAGILNCLKKDAFRAINIVGMRGVGKTTLAMNVHDRIVKDWNNFSGVYWVYASTCYTVHHLQEKVAELFGIDLQGGRDDMTRFEILSKGLSTKRKFLLFLDGVRFLFRPEFLGISFERSGCKLILTSDTYQGHERMGYEKQMIIYPLNEDKAWTLFEETIGYDNILFREKESNLARKYALELTKECAGLPLGVITMAISMKTVEDIEEWENAFLNIETATERCDYKKIEMFHILKHCYDRLINEQVKQCFLYCSVYPEGFEIQRKDLIEFFIDIGLIREDNKQIEYLRGHAIINELENANLLERGGCHLIPDNVDLYWVRMHSLVRDMALRLQQSEFLVKAGFSLSEIPDQKEWTNHDSKARLQGKSLDLVSLMHNCIEDISISPNCPLLSILLLQGNQSLKRISSDFLDQLPMLRVLDLSETSIHELPSSVGDLVELAALILRNCRNLQAMPSLAKLTQLRKLDLYCTAVTRVPEGLEMLVKLEYLSLYMTGIEKLPTGILPKLQHLRHLEVDKASRIEVAGVGNLETIHASFYDLEEFHALFSTTDSGSEEE